MANWNIQGALDQLYKPALDLNQAPAFLQGTGYFDKPKPLSYNDAITQANKMQENELILQKEQLEAEAAQRNEEKRKRYAALAKDEQGNVRDFDSVLTDAIGINNEYGDIQSSLAIQEARSKLDDFSNTLKRVDDITKTLGPEAGYEYAKNSPALQQRGLIPSSAESMGKPDYHNVAGRGLVKVINGRAVQVPGGEAIRGPQKLDVLNTIIGLKRGLPPEQLGVSPETAALLLGEPINAKAGKEAAGGDTTNILEEAQKLIKESAKGAVNAVSGPVKKAPTGRGGGDVVNVYRRKVAQ